MNIDYEYRTDCVVAQQLLSNNSHRVVSTLLLTIDRKASATIN